jgi:hypothetical protein
MNENSGSTQISYDEWLARFILYRGHVRPDNTIRPDAFYPPKSLELSVTRQIGLSQPEVWLIGQDVSEIRQLPLFGRADIQVRQIYTQPLRVQSQPVPENPNHAVIIDWPGEKFRQKIIAEELASFAQYVPVPE